MTSNITDTVKSAIKNFACGYVFTAKDFPLPIEKQKTVNKLLDNFVVMGQIRRLSKGRFYKPKISKLGELYPDIFQVIKDLIEKNGETIGYMTGYSIFSKFGLTTEVPVTLQVAMNKAKKSITRGNYRINFIIQPNAITKENVPVLQLLDCLHYFKDIPNAMPNDTCSRLLLLFTQLRDKQKSLMKNLALKYNPATIAF
jgi:predicted transcriptional regulator of viral defense system